MADRYRFRARHLLWLLLPVPFVLTVWGVGRVLDELEPSEGRGAAGEETRPGTRAELEERGVRFPGWALDPELLEEVFVRPSGERRAGFARRWRGEAGVWFGGEEEWTRYDAEGMPRERRSVPADLDELQFLEAADEGELELRIVGARSNGDSPVSLLLDGETLWREVAMGGSAWRGIAPVRRSGGGYCVALAGGGEHLVLDVEGEELWFRGVDYYDGPSALRSHPELPDVYAALERWKGVVWYRASDGEAIGETSVPEECTLESFVVFPGPDGARRSLLGGARLKDSGGELVLHDDAGRAVWTATLPSPVEKIARIDDSGAPRFAVTTLEGELFVVDAEGTLLHCRTLCGSGGAYSGILDLAAGALDEEHAGIAVTGECTSLYRLPR